MDLRMSLNCHHGEAEAILRNCPNAMPAHAELLIIERLLPELIDLNGAAARENLLSDIDMMVTAGRGGREHSEAEYRTPLVKSGLALQPRHPHARNIGHH